MSNQIPFLHPSRRSPGAVYHWKPSPRLRRAGWTNVRLGEDWDAALDKARARNREVAAWEQGNAGRAETGRAPRRLRWRDLVRRYRESDRYPENGKSRANYDSYIALLDAWALDGELLLSDLDRPMIIDLRDALVKDKREYRTAALLRVLSVLLRFGADKGVLPLGIGDRLDIPSPPKRTRRIRRDHLPLLLEAADALGFAHVRLGIVLGFYSMQREGDLLSATGFQIRPVEDVSSDARRALAGADGKVSGLWLQQEKTGSWVAVSLAPEARAEVEGAIAAGRARARAEGEVACTNLILYRNEDRACPEWRFQRDFRAVVDHAIAQATERQQHELARLLAGDPARARDAIQFRDLRRSGMCWLREMAVPVPLIASISGHSIEETQKILDTYMPRDSRAAAEGMALAVARQAARDAAAEIEAEEIR